MAALAKNLWTVFKLRISLAIMLCALAGIAVATGPALTGSQVTLLSLAVLLSAASSGAFNHYVECDLDARMPRTRDRPFVTGYFRRGPMWLCIILGLLALSVLLAGFATNWASAPTTCDCGMETRAWSGPKFGSSSAPRNCLSL